MTTTDDPMDKRTDTVGKLQPHVEAKVVDPNDPNKTLGINERGELAVTGYLLMKEYWGDPKKTAEAMVPDKDDPNKVWMLTGDEASMDELGYVSITGRIKDIIIRGGENIGPLEIESCLLAHDDIVEVSVVGIPDERYGEVVAAFTHKKTSSKLTAEEIRSLVREKLSGHLGVYTPSTSVEMMTDCCLVPKYVFWVNEFPKTASGKIQKFKLREDGAKLVKDGQGLE
jgi:acyl-CoA synthetase (AMP-forming)/AMP-acid ligase II